MADGGGGGGMFRSRMCMCLHDFLIASIAKGKGFVAKNYFWTSCFSAWSVIRSD